MHETCEEKDMNPFKSVPFIINVQKAYKNLLANLCYGNL